jgi:hypothetical protein
MAPLQTSGSDVTLPPHQNVACPQATVTHSVAKIPGFQGLIIQRCDVVAVGGVLELYGRTAVGAVGSLLTSPCFRKGAESRRRHGARGVPSLFVYRGEPDGTPVLFPVA